MCGPVTPVPLRGIFAISKTCVLVSSDITPVPSGASLLPLGANAPFIKDITPIPLRGIFTISKTCVLAFSDITPVTSVTPVTHFLRSLVNSAHDALSQGKR